MTVEEFDERYQAWVMSPEANLWEMYASLMAEIRNGFLQLIQVQTRQQVKYSKWTTFLPRHLREKRHKRKAIDPEALARAVGCIK